MAEKKPDSVVCIRVPYKNLKQTAEVELVGFDDNSPSKSWVSNGVGDDDSPDNCRHSQSLRSENCNLITLILSCAVAAGVQFGWALQLSLLTPYVQVFFFLLLCLLLIFEFCIDFNVLYTFSLF